MQLEMKKVGHNFVNQPNTVDMSSRGFRARSCFTKSHPAQYMHTIKHTVALCTRLFPMFINILPCNAVHHHTMGAVARSLIRRKLHILVWTEQKPQGEERGGGDMGGMRLCFGGQGLTRNPNTGLPPGSLHMAGTATTLVISSQMVSMRPSVPWGISGSGSLLIRLLSSTGTCMQTMHHHLILFRSHMQIYSHKFLLKRTVALAPACRPCIITWFWSDHTYRCKITYS